MLLSTILLQAAGAAVWGKIAGAFGAAIAALAAAWGIAMERRESLHGVGRCAFVRSRTA